MSGKIKIFSGKDLVRIFERYGFVTQRTVGSHIRLAFGTHRITIPLHKEVKKGTTAGIVKEFESIFGIESTKKEFYTK